MFRIGYRPDFTSGGLPSGNDHRGRRVRRLLAVQGRTRLGIGVFGGTFDPPHNGHIAIALEVRHQLRLDTVLLVVANDPWQKSAVGSVTPADLRLELTRTAIAGIEGLEVSTVEIDRGGESYTADTLETLSADMAHAELFLLVGSDAAMGLDTWKRPEAVRALATTVVVDRGGRQGGRPPEGWPHRVIDVPALEISSSDLRARFADGRPVEALMPRETVDAVRRAGIYGCGL